MAYVVAGSMVMPCIPMIDMHTYDLRILMVYAVTAYIVPAYVVMANVVMAYVVMASMVMTRI